MMNSNLYNTINLKNPKIKDKLYLDQKPNKQTQGEKVENSLPQIANTYSIGLQSLKRHSQSNRKEKQRIKFHALLINKEKKTEVLMHLE